MFSQLIPTGWQVAPALYVASVEKSHQFSHIFAIMKTCAILVCLAAAHVTDAFPNSIEQTDKVAEHTSKHFDYHYCILE